jgi:uncharacterized repeat protein (TIGR01451 family)
MMLQKKFRKERRLMSMEGSGRRSFVSFVFFLTGVFFLAGISFAQPQSAKLELKTVAEKEITVTKQGKTTTQRVPLDKANPKDIVVYTITYSNAGKGPILDAVIVDPIPKGVVYVPDSAEGKDAEIRVSIDNGRFWQKPPVMIEFRKPDGSLERKPAPPEMYTHLQWVIKKPVAPGQSGQVSFKAMVK